MTTTEPAERTIGDLSQATEVPQWLLRRWYDAGTLGIPARRVARLRTILAADWDAVVQRVRDLYAKHNHRTVTAGNPSIHKLV